MITNIKVGDDGCRVEVWRMPDGRLTAVVDGTCSHAEGLAPGRAGGRFVGCWAADDVATAHIPHPIAEVIGCHADRTPFARWEEP